MSDKNGLVPFAAALRDLGFELVSTGGTARTLQAAGLPVVPISDVTRFPEMLDGRVKTLHPAVHGGILARRDHLADMEAIRAHGISPCDVVVVNLYPFAKAAANPDTGFEALIEEIDIGGPSMVRAAAKNFKDVLVLVEPADYEPTLEAMRAPGGPSLAFRFGLARKAFAHTAAYDSMIASTLSDVATGPSGLERPDPRSLRLPTLLTGHWRKVRDLRYGENPHQTAAWYRDDPGSGLGSAAVLQGKELSYTNLLDLDAAARIALEFREPAAAVIKHTNPCGVATATAIDAAYVAAREADAVSAFGGIIGLNRAIDENTARAIASTFIEAVVAPGIEDAARAVLATKTNLRVVIADFEQLGRGAHVEFRSILGAMLLQQRDRVVEADAEWPGEGDGVPRVVTRRVPTTEEWQALRFAWKVCAHVKSNTVLFAGADRTLAIGAGQMSRVDAVKVAVMKAPVSLNGSVAASDAFFPFRDGLDAIATAGATAIVQPGGSVRDKEVIAAADEHGLAMVFTGRRHFRH